MVGLQSIVSRSTDPLETVVVGVGVIRAGTQYNIVAEHAEIEGTTRTFSQPIREFTNSQVTRIAKSIAEQYGATAEVEFTSYANPLVNDPEATEEVAAVTEPLCGKEAIIRNHEKALGADDFADFLAAAKGMYAFVGTRNAADPNTGAAHHHGLFDIDESALLLSCNVYVDYALWVLQH